MMTGNASACVSWEAKHTDCVLGGPLDRPSGHWQKALANGTLRQDPSQEVVLPVLDQVAARLTIPVQRVAWRGVEVWRGLENDFPATQGIYLHGDVGRGKSLLMQFIFDSVPIEEKRRVHFHPFMEELHQRMHHARPPAKVDLILHLASLLSSEARLLCFDEFYITNIADGILLGRLLEALHQCGVTVCATSNWAPDHLFQDGFNRGSVLPFIALLKKRIQVCELGHGVDWRRQSPTRSGQTTHSAEEWFTHVANSPPQPAPIVLRHTTISALGICNGVFWFDFAQLCGRMLGRAEYINLCRQAKLILISGLPRISDDEADMAMRFVVLVDLLYEHQIPIRIFSLVDLEQACPDGPVAFAWRRLVSRVHELSRMS